MAISSSQSFRQERSQSLAGRLADANRHLLALRFALFNTVAAALTFAVYLQGWLDQALSGYTLWLCAVIAAVFVYGWALCAGRVWRTSAEHAAVLLGHVGSAARAHEYLDAIARSDREGRAIAVQLLRLRLSGEIAIVMHTANTLVFLGLVGTVIGFIIALSGVDPALAGTADNVGPMVAKLVYGMSIALYTTLLGAVLHLWLVVNYRLLASGTIRLFHAIVECGERRGVH